MNDPLDADPYASTKYHVVGTLTLVCFDERSHLNVQVDTTVQAWCDAEALDAVGDLECELRKAVAFQWQPGYQIHIAGQEPPDFVMRQIGAPRLPGVDEP